MIYSSKISSYSNNLSHCSFNSFWYW